MYDERIYYLKIDPSFNTMGICLYDPSADSMQLYTGDFFQCQTWIRKNCNLDEVIAIVENSDLDSTTFKMWGIMDKAIKSYKVGKKSIGAVQSDFLICMNFAQKVGKSKSASKLIIALLQRANVPVIEVAPSARDKAFKEKYENGKKIKTYKDVRFLKQPTKTTAEQFQQLTGYHGSSSEHARDAATLYWGVSRKMILGILEANRHERTKQPSVPTAANNNYKLVDRKKRKNPF